MSAITIVVADPQDAIVTRVREIMACWTSAGLLERVLWWTGEKDGDHRARWSDGDTEADLGEQVAIQRCETIRVVAFLPLAAGQEATSVPRRAADAVLRMVTEAASPAQDVYSLALVVPATHVTTIPASHLASAWDVNLVAADEDRVTSDQAATFVRRPDDLAPHAASILATAAGLWRGMRAAPFDGDVKGAGQQDPRARVVRSFVRAVRSHDLVPAVAGEVFALVADDEWLEVALSATSARHPESVVARAAQEYLAGPGTLLTWAPHTPRGSVTLLSVGLWEALKALWRFIQGRAVSYPGERFDPSRENLARTFAEFVQDQTFGPDLPVVVALGGQPVTPGRAVGFVDSLIERLEAQREPLVFGDTWPALRALAFGLVDTGPLPEGCTEPRTGRNRMVVTTIEAICPDPSGEAFPLPPEGKADSDEDAAAASPQVPVCDPARARLAQARLTADPAPATAGDGPPPPGDGAAPSLDEELERWLAQRRHSLLWIIGDRIVDAAEQAQRAVRDTLKTLRQSLPEPAPEPDVRPLRGRLLALTVCGLAGVGLGVGAGALGAPLWVSTVIVLLALVGGFGGALLMVYDHLRARFQLANQRNRALEDYLGAIECAEHATQALVRLITAYEQYLDWAKIIGRVLYSSRTPDDGVPEDPLDACELVMPKAMDLARGRTDLERRTHLAFGAGKFSVKRGWIGACFAEFTQREMEALKDGWWRGAHEPEPDPDVESAARGHLLRVLESRESEPLLTGWMRERVADFLRGRRPSELFTSLDDVKGHALEVSPAGFLTAIFPPPGPPGRFDGFAHRLWRLRATGSGPEVRIMGWRPAAVDLPHSGAQIQTLDPNPQGGDALTLLVARLDATRPMPLEDLSIFTEAPKSRPPEAEPAPTGLG
jgi:hypothetical protein